MSWSKRLCSTKSEDASSIFLFLESKVLSDAGACNGRHQSNMQTSYIKRGYSKPEATAWPDSLFAARCLPWLQTDVDVARNPVWWCRQAYIAAYYMQQSSAHYMQQSSALSLETMELQWKDYVTQLKESGTLSNALAVADVSASMFGEPIQVGLTNI